MSRRIKYERKTGNDAEALEQEKAAAKALRELADRQGHGRKVRRERIVPASVIAPASMTVGSSYKRDVRVWVPRRVDDPEIRTRMLEYMEEGEHPTVAMHLCGLDERHVYEHMRNDAQLCAEVKEALGKGARLYRQAMASTADSKAAGTYQWLLERIYPSLYKAQPQVALEVNVEASGKVNSSEVVISLADAELIARNGE